jgi:phosphoribosylcarboxyaminoimidazole (NCAIR) mutase
MTTTITPEALDTARAVQQEMREYLDQEVEPDFDVIERWADRLAALSELLAAQPASSAGIIALPNERVSMTLAQYEALKAASSAGAQEPVATYCGRRLTPEGTREFWGMLADGVEDLPRGSRLYAAPVAGEAARIETALRDALTYVGQRSDGDLATLAERAEVWMRESRCLIDSLQKTIGFRDANIVSLEKQMDKLIDDRRDGSPAPAAVPVGHVSVIQQDANNYCLILRLLGMEDEGDPVAEVRQLVEARDSQPAAQGVDLGQFRPFVQKERTRLANNVDKMRLQLSEGLRPEVREKIKAMFDEEHRMMGRADDLLAMIDSQHQQKESGDV